ncbi:MAG: virulence factor SrfC family protein, partial [Rubricella sp.]
MTDQTELSKRAADVAKAAQDAIAWVLDPANAETVGSEAKGLSTLLRRNARRAQRLSKAASNKMAVSVFGPSQAGKSFLVSVLARPQDGALVADFPGPGGQLDYISEINPEGEGESTGLVTRFTMTKAPAPEGYPIGLRLLSEADILRTIINSFFMDGDENAEAPPTADALSARIAAARAQAGTGDPGLTEDDIWDTRDYVEQNFRSRAYAAALQSFWAEAAAIAPKLSIPARGDLLSVLWGGHEPLTALYVKLAQARATLGEGDLVHAQLDALTPRETSIIDVKTLKGLFGGGGTLSVMPSDGRARDVDRAVICALTAELIMPMLEKPWDMFDETDMLDFPGARNRFKDPLASTLKEPEKNVPELLLRGKVAYLFDRYVAEQEITAMLLCIPDSNMEAIDLPRLVEDWITLTHGATAEERARAECILFFILTKFDKHLGESAADGGPATRFQRRMEASFEKFWRHSDSWPKQWTPGKPFTNCYWLR